MANTKDEEKVKTLLQAVSPTIEEYKTAQAQKSRNGEVFNVFKILGGEKDEVHLHSALLCELLNPHGTHGADDFFLQSFVKDVAKVDETLDFESADVISEHSIGGISADKKSGGRLDIAIFFTSPDYLILIENKIDAGDQERQLQRYSNYAKKEYGKNHKILYLTKDGHAPSKFSLGKAKINFDCVSYKADIRNWLKKCADNFGAKPSVEVPLFQYIAVIEELTSNEAEDKMKEEVIKMLYAKGNGDKAKAAAEFAEIWAEKDKIISKILAEKLIAEGWEDRGGQVYKKIDDNVELFFEYGNDYSASLGFHAIKRFRNKTALKVKLDDLPLDCFEKDGDVQFDDEYIYIYFSYKIGGTIDDFYASIKNIFAKLEEKYKNPA